MNETTLAESWENNVAEMFPNGFTPSDEFGDINYEQIISRNPDYITLTLRTILRSAVGEADRLIYFRDGHMERYKVYNIEPVDPPLDDVRTLHTFGYAAYNWWKEHKC